MSEFYRSIDGDVLDLIALKQYPRRGPISAGVLHPDPALIAEILSANPGLAAYGPTPPADTVISLPAAPEPASRPRVTLW